MLQLMNVGITFFRGTVNEKQALKSVDLTLHDGDFVTVIGGNGAGKSTLLNVISGLYRVDQGKIVIDGEDITYLKEHERAKYVGRVFQDPMTGTAADMTIEENMALALRRGKKRGLRNGLQAKDKSMFIEVLKSLDLGLEDRLTTRAGLLSGGQRQAITLLMSTLLRPNLLLLDEHTAALDPKTAAKVLHITQEVIREHQLTTLMVTHNMRDALAYGNRMLVLDEGSVLMDIPEETKKALTVEDLLKLFERKSNSELVSDRMLLS